MHIMTSNEKKQKGAIIIEASIVLPVFMFFMMTILSIAHIAYLQAKVAVSLDRTAKQIASYSHIWYATGYGDIFSGDSGKSSKVFDELAGYLEEIGDFIGSDTLISASKSLYETNLTNIFKDELAESMATAMLYRNILGTKEPIDSELEKFERKFHIDHNSWTMAGSKYLNNNTEVFLKISYKVHVIRLLSIEKTFQLAHCSYCEAWRGVGEKVDSSPGTKVMEENPDGGTESPEAGGGVPSDDSHPLEITKSVTSGATQTPKVTKVPTTRAKTTPKVTKVPTARASTTPKVTKVPTARASTTPKVTKVPTARASMTPKVTRSPSGGAMQTPKTTEPASTEPTQIPAPTNNNSYGESLRISGVKMHQLGSHFEKHGRGMGYASKNDYNQGAREFFENHKTDADIFEAVYNGRGAQNGRTQIIMRYDRKYLIIDKDSGQIIDFYPRDNGDEFRAFNRGSVVQKQ